MSKRQIGVVLLSCSLLFVADGCKKKAPAPPPPPPKAEVKPPPPPPPAKPVIASFTVEPSTIDQGQSATLRWSVTGANTVAIDNGVGSVQPSGSRSVSPSGTTTYRLQAQGEGGSAESTVTLRVNPPPPPPPPPPPTARKTLSDLLRDYGVDDAYFDYDKSDIREDARAVLTRNADALKRAFSEAEGTILIEGHCDERGSAEYNLALGDRRATAARDFLVQLGVSADRLKVISYGKEKPQCTEPNESCWQRNRRAHFVTQ